MGLAVNFIPPPDSIVVALDDMLSDAGDGEAMDITIEFEVAVFDTTPVKFEVSTQVTACPFVMLLLVKMELLVPAFTPLTFH